MSAIYYFKAKDPNKRVVSGRVKASSMEEVEEKLMSRQLVLIKASTAKKEKMNFVLSGVGKNALVVATRQLSFLISASVPVVQALDTVAGNTSDVSLKKILTKLARLVESGKSFSQALKMFPTVFDEIYVNVVRSGEEGGSLDSMLKQLSVYIEKTHSIKRKIRSGMMYPGFIVVAASGIVVGIMVFLVPKFESIFSDSGRDLPALTQLVINISHFMINHFMIMIMGVIGAVVGIIAFSRTYSGKKIIETISLNFPVLGDLFRKYYIARLSRVLASLLASGGQIAESLMTSGKSVGSIHFKEAVERVVRLIQSGYSLAKSMSRESLFPGLVKNMIAVGEQTGNIDEVLNKISEFYEEQVDVAVENLLKLIEPVLIVGIAFVVAFIVVAMYLPIFEMGQMLGG